MRAYWTGVARHGFPSSAGQPLWPPFTTAGQRIQSLVPPTPRGETDFAAVHKCAFWNQGG
jgi:carboxylesterase type B